MDRLISCEFNMDTACVELKFLDGDAAAARLPYRDNRNKPWLSAKTATAGQALKAKTATEAGQNTAWPSA